MVRVSVMAQNTLKSNGIPRTATIVRREGLCVIFRKYLIELSSIYLWGVFSFCFIRNNRHTPQAMLLPGQSPTKHTKHDPLQPQLGAVWPSHWQLCSHIARQWQNTDTSFVGTWPSCPPHSWNNSHVFSPFLKKLFKLLFKSYIHK